MENNDNLIIVAKLKHYLFECFTQSGINSTQTHYLLLVTYLWFDAGCTSWDPELMKAIDDSIHDLPLEMAILNKFSQRFKCLSMLCHRWLHVPEKVSREKKGNPKPSDQSQTRWWTHKQCGHLTTVNIQSIGVTNQFITNLKASHRNIQCRQGLSLILPAYRDPRSKRAIKVSFFGIQIAPNVSDSCLSIKTWTRHYQDNDQKSGSLIIQLPCLGQRWTMALAIQRLITCNILPNLRWPFTTPLLRQRKNKTK